MNNFHHTQDTICAIATAQGGAIGVIRVSGAEAVSIVQRIFIPTGKKKLADCPPSTLNFGTIRDAEGAIVDEVLVSLFRAPHSYTGEDTVEISCHGSAYILREVMQLLINAGCRTATPGEFTQRAFLNGKMDLSQAEAVADVIASTSRTSHQLAMSQLRGGFSKQLGVLRDKLLHLTSLMELELDFSDHEDLEFVDRSELQALNDEIYQYIYRLVQSFSVGNAIKEGIPVAIIGTTNTGKSTLLNALLEDDKAIVSDIHGTTRDVIEDTVNIGGVKFRFIDTAGIRETTEEIENIGIKRSFKAMEQAQIILLMQDLSRPSSVFQQFYTEIAPQLEGKHVIWVQNKCDALLENSFTPPHADWKSIQISAREGLHLSELRELLVQTAAIPAISAEDVMVTNTRHYEALTRALYAIERVQTGLTSGLSGDLVAQDLRECLLHLGEIVGEVTTDNVLHNIFRNFCIGK